MNAMVLEKQRRPLVLRRDVPVPVPGAGEVLVRVEACGVCRTDLHIIDGELAVPRLPVIPGHEVAGRVERVGPGVSGFNRGDLVGIPWLGHTCGACRYCGSGRENLCENAKFTGYSLDGGFADFVVAEAGYVFHIPDRYSAARAAPLLCAGLIGFRSLEKAGNGRRVGLYGFGAAAHIICQVCVFQGREVYAFTRDGDTGKQEFARSLGAVWTGGSGDMPPRPLDAAIIFAPAGGLVPAALRAVDRGGRVVCAGIYMSDIPGFPYADLWLEKELVSVANLTRRDGVEFMKLASSCHIETSVTEFALHDANRAVDEMRNGRLRGAAVLVPGSS